MTYKLLYSMFSQALYCFDTTSLPSGDIKTKGPVMYLVEDTAFLVCTRPRLQSLAMCKTARWLTSAMPILESWKQGDQKLSHPQLHLNFEDSLCYIRPYL